MKQVENGWAIVNSKGYMFGHATLKGEAVWTFLWDNYQEWREEVHCKTLRDKLWKRCRRRGFRIIKARQTIETL